MSDTEQTKEWKGWQAPERLEVDTGRGTIELTAYEMRMSPVGRRVDIVTFQDGEEITTIDLTLLDPQELRAIAKWMSEAADWMEEDES